MSTTGGINDVSQKAQAAMSVDVSEEAVERVSFYLACDGQATETMKKGGDMLRELRRQLTEAQARVQELEKGLSLLSRAESLFQQAVPVSGYCMCGSPENAHGLESGHAYTDMGTYHGDELARDIAVFNATQKE